MTQGNWWVRGFVAAGVMAAGIGFTGSAAAGSLLRLKKGTVGVSDLDGGAADLAFPKAAVEATFVLQFRGAITQRDRDDLERRGVKVTAYLPDDALILHGPALEVVSARFAFGDRIQGLVAYEPSWRASDDAMEEDARKEDSSVIYSVSVLDARLTNAVASEARSTSGVLSVHVDGRDLVVQAARGTLARLIRIEGVEWIEPVPVMVTFDLPVDGSEVEPRGARLKEDPPPPPALTGHESGTRLMRFEAAWERGLRGEGQRVAVGDTGLDRGDANNQHADFSGVFHMGIPLGLGSTSWADPHGHGTHVCGSVVGIGAASAGQLRGGAHEAQLIMAGLWSPLLNNLAPGSDFNRIFGAPYREGARIHTNSWGNPRNLGQYDSIASRVDEYLWNNPEMLVLFAAGNSGQDLDRDGRIDENSVASPGTAKNVLTVGASENKLEVGGIQKPHVELREGERKWGVEPIRSDRLSDDENGIAAFSSRGPTADGRMKPDIVAPGTNIVSTRSRHEKAGTLWGAYNADYLYAGGTSMATPLTAGAAAVVREHLVKERAQVQPSGALVKAVLIHTAEDLFPGQYGLGAQQELKTRRPNVHEGYGRVDMDAATALGEDTLLLDEKGGIALSQEKGITMRVGADGRLRATLAYTDAPAAASAAKTLVNDLDLKVVSPGGRVFQPGDRTNNVEMVELEGLEAGDYRVVVTAVNVPNGRGGKQPFALVAGR